MKVLGHVVCNDYANACRCRLLQLGTGMCKEDLVGCLQGGYEKFCPERMPSLGTVKKEN